MSKTDPIAGDAINQIAALAAQARGVTTIVATTPEGVGGLPPQVLIGVRHGDRPELVSLKAALEEWRVKPERRGGTARALTLASFNALVTRHASDHSAVFANTDWRKPSLMAVIDYHPLDRADGADYAKHRIAYEFPLSEPWRAWVEAHGKAMSQGDFAAFIEDHIADLTTPSEDHRAEIEAMFGLRVATPAEVQQLSRGLQINVDSVVRNVQNLHSGEVQIAFEESHKDAGGAALRVPGVFLLRVAPFFMGDPVTLPVRLRYRVKDGKITWSCHLYRPDLHVTERIRADLHEVGQVTGLPVFEGAPES